MARRTRFESADLAAVWEQQAPNWVEWVRRDKHDRYWQFNRDVFLEIVPPPGRRTLDLGCGEGRLSRDLKALGHDVVGVDLSPTMIASAREADPSIEVHEADAAKLPFDDGAFDIVVAFMSLQDVEDLAGAIAESARVLEPGGHLCMVIVHPLNSAGLFAGEDEAGPFVIDGSYLAPSYYEDEIERDGLGLTLASAHRPLEAYTDALAAAGFVIERLREPPVPDHAVASERMRRWTRVPLFLYVRAVVPERLQPA